MNTSNYPTGSEQETPRKSPKTAIIIILGIACLATWGYLIAHNNSTEAVVQQNQTQIAKINDDKSSVQKSFDESLIRLDSMSGLSMKLKGQLTEKNSDIAKKKREIRAILNKKNATAAELAQATAMIAQLNDKITGMEQDVARLTTDNQSLTQDKAVLTQDKQKLTDDLTTTTVAKDSLTKEVDVASTLNASNIAITPVDVKSNGKEKVTTTAKRVNKLVITFDVNNRIAESGKTDVYVCVAGPDGKNIATTALGSGTFTTREEGDKPFTAKLPVDLQTDKKKNVEFSFAPGANFQQGSYKIQIYQNGFKIGEGTRELKKGGLFS